MSITLDHLPFVRSKPCSVKSPDCKGPIIAHHMVPVGSGNNRKRASYRHLSAIPLCDEFHHTHFHNMTYEEFQTEFSTPGKRVDLFKIALSLMIEDIFGRSEPFFNDQIRE